VRYVLVWTVVTLAVYALGGLWVGTQLRPAVQRYEQNITGPVTQVTSILEGRR